MVPATTVPNTELPTGDYNAMSEAIYDAQLGAFNTLYQAAKEETNVSKRYALMAQAEAKLLEAAVLIPGTTNGGNYGLSRVAKRSASTVLWGNDSDRFHNVLVTTELITAEDQTHLKAMWNEVRGTTFSLLFNSLFLILLTFSQEMPDFSQIRGFFGIAVGSTGMIALQTVTLFSFFPILGFLCEVNMKETIFL